MKRIIFLACTAFCIVFLFSCTNKKEVPKQAPETPVIKEEKTETPAPEPAPVVPEPAPEPEPVVEPVATPAPTPVEPTEEDKEYVRSTSQMEGNVSKEVFNEDKKQILQIISELDAIMKNHDYDSWLTYIDDESLTYWQDRRNLHRVSSRLPVKGLQLDTLHDYFIYVFIQSRVGRQIDEIRYISDISVKAVQVREDQDIVFYYFQKVDGKWKLHLPPLSD